MMQKLFVATCATVISTAAMAVEISPNTNNGSGQIPSGHWSVNFTVYNGNWVRNINLPTNPSNRHTVTINSKAAYKSNIDTTNTDLPFAKLVLSKGQSYSFKYNNWEGKWLINTSTQLPVDRAHETSVNVGDDLVSHFKIRNGRWTKFIKLPDTAKNGQLVKISSSAAWKSQVKTDNILFNSNYKLHKGQSFWFKFNETLGKWVPESIDSLKQPVRSTYLATPDSAIISYSIDNQSPNTIRLPATANDRDRIIIKSNDYAVRTIQANNLESASTKTIANGESYTFIYIASKQHWAMVSHPTTVLNANQINNGNMSKPSKPVTRVNFGDNNWVADLNLPNDAALDDAIIVNSNANWGFNVKANNGLNKLMNKGEIARFRKTNTGWKLETNTIDMLLVNSPEITEVLGESAAKIRLYESMRLTNEAAENSNAEFYIRSVGYITHKIAGETINEELSNGRNDNVVQDKRNDLEADGVYYQTNRSGGGCGLAWVKASAYNMIGANNLSCSPAAARHEIGHNLGLRHGTGYLTSDRPSRGFKHPLGSTIMGGNKLPYYSTPKKYHVKYGYALGVENVIDGVKTINEHAALVKDFR